MILRNLTFFVLEEQDTEESVREQVLAALDECTEKLENEAAKKEEATGEATASKDEATGEVSASKDETPVIEEVDEGDGEAEGDDADSGQGDDENVEPTGDGPEIDGEVEEEISNLQLSWEMLDLARAIWQK